MPRFKNAASQARYRVAGKAHHGRSRHKETKKSSSFIASVGTERTYRGQIKRFISYLQKIKIDFKSATEAIANEFLKIKSETVVQKTLDGYRQAIQMVFNFELEYVVSKKPSILTPRAYRTEQIAFLIDSTCPALQLSIRIATYAGLRAIELDTIERASEMKEDDRDWLPERFTGRENDVAYTVCGKGGLYRKILLSQELATELEKTRLETVVIKRQREINYKKRYGIVGGHSFSLQFSRLSFRVLGWSTGAHGLRHKYAQERIQYLQMHQFSYKDALQIVSQELGHFSIQNTLAYLR